MRNKIANFTRIPNYARITGIVWQMLGFLRFERNKHVDLPLEFVGRARVEIAEALAIHNQLGLTRILEVCPTWPKDYAHALLEALTDVFSEKSESQSPTQLWYWKVSLLDYWTFSDFLIRWLILGFEAQIVPYCFSCCILSEIRSKNPSFSDCFAWYIAASAKMNQGFAIMAFWG